MWGAFDDAKLGGPALPLGACASDTMVSFCIIQSYVRKGGGFCICNGQNFKTGQPGPTGEGYARILKRFFRIPYDG